MANKPVPELIQAELPLNLLELLHVVQNSNSRRVSLSNVRDALDGQLSRTLVKPAGTQGALKLSSASVTVTLNGSSVTAAALIPANCIVLAVTSYVINGLTGTLTSFDVGWGSTLTAFGASIPTPAGSNKIGVVAPFPTVSPLDVIVTAKGGVGSDNTNKLRLVAYYLSFNTPQS